MIKLFQKNRQSNGNNQIIQASPNPIPDMVTPKTSLKGKIISQHLLNIIPKTVSQKYSAVFFEESATNLKLAVGHPEKLKSNFHLALENIEKKLNKKIELFQVNPDEIAEIFQSTATPPRPQAVQQGNNITLTKPIPAYQNNQYRFSLPPKMPVQITLPKPVIQKPPLITTASSSQSPATPITAVDHSITKLPKLYIQGEIPYEVFSHIPYFFAQNHRFICIDYAPPNQYSVASEAPNSPETRVIVEYLKKNNNIDVTLFQASAREFDFLLREYKEREAQKTNAIHKQKLELNKQFSHAIKNHHREDRVTRRLDKQPILSHPTPKVDETMSIRETKLAEDVVTPDLKGKIVSGEKEKVGFSGAIEKIGSLFSVPKVVTPENIEPIDLKPENITLNLNSSINELDRSGALPKKIIIRDHLETDHVASTAVSHDRKSDQEEESKDDENLGSLLKKDIESIDELKAIVKENNIPKIVAAIVSYAISQNASDIHVEPFEDEFLVRFRIDGQLRNIIKLPPDMHAPLVSRIKILSKLKLDETRIPQDGRFNVTFSSREVDLRVSTMPAVHGEKGVLRILDKSKGVISLENLGFEGMGFDVLINAINRPYGIIMATGPTGSGKSTTLYAILARVATSTVNVITLEDPVEYEMKGINQSQINPKIGYTFADGLRSILRQDPNIIMVGEVRDAETANMATQAALTGHLVLTTLHTNTASGALPRLINMGIEPFLITSSINAIIGQRLVRKICEHCKSEINLPGGIVKEVEDELTKIAMVNQKDQARIKRPFKFYQGKGCERCRNTGYSGRLGIYEILPMSERIEELTINRSTANQMLDQAVKEGMITMKQDGILKVLEGITALDEILKETSEK